MVMVFHPQNFIKTAGRIVLSGDVRAIAHPCLNKPILKELWHNFTFRSTTLDIRESEEPMLLIGDAQKPALDRYDYSINVETGGICICAKSEKDLIRAFMTLIDQFQAIDGGKLDDKIAVALDCGQIREQALIQNRMVHFCIFPETELWEVQRFIRLCGALKYTHVVLEFWGMLQYDCMKELSWRQAFTKEQIRPLVREANDLGLEIIPMFNHWGHASAARMMHGKHVVLDQNPTLQTYFSEDGWCWDIRKPKVRGLLRQIREELIELCGEGDYFHIGCDEAFNFAFTPDNMDRICGFLNEISEEMLSHRRRVIVWGDMFLYRHAHYKAGNRYSCNAPTAEAERYMLERLRRDLVIADWQYDAPQAPVETAAVFTGAGFDCLMCPYDLGEAQMHAVCSTVKQQALFGLLHTTWHTLSYGMPYVTRAGVEGWECTHHVKAVEIHTKTATLLRKVMPIGGDYTKAGWGKFQVGVRW